MLSRSNMELFQARDHFIIQSGEHALWCNRFDGSLTARTGNYLDLFDRCQLIENRPAAAFSGRWSVDILFTCNRTTCVKESDLYPCLHCGSHQVHSVLIVWGRIYSHWAATGRVTTTGVRLCQGSGDPPTSISPLHVVGQLV